MFLRVQNRQVKGGETHYYAAVVRNDRNENGKVKQTVIKYIGKIDKEQIPYLKAAYAINKPRLIYADGCESPQRKHT